VIIGAGPAGLTAAYEILTRTNLHPIVLEATDTLGGISRTTVHNGNRIDIGGHRFFSKSDRVMAWWQAMLPVQRTDAASIPLRYQGSATVMAAASEGVAAGPDPESTDRVLLIRPRKSRIYFLGRLFDYPLSLSLATMRGLGIARLLRIGVSYGRASLRPIRNERNLEDFLINRFGRELYQTFFKSYTEKVWGVSCRTINAEWGAQRIKGLNIRRAIVHAMSRFLPRGKPATAADAVAQKQTETSLIDQFLYPKFGPGQMWETCADKIIKLGGEIHLNARVTEIHTDGNRCTGVTIGDATSEPSTGVPVGSAGELTRRVEAEYVISSMPIVKLVRAIADAPTDVREVAEGLMYRDFITVGVLLRQMQSLDTNHQPMSDNWLYVQDQRFSVGRIQIFNNWSPWLVRDPAMTWLGMEYFCSKGDAMWQRSDEAITSLAIEELVTMGVTMPDDVVDHVVLRVPKAYPAYWGTYENFDIVRRWSDTIENLFLVGRNGMHRYNNQDHSMLTAMVAVDNIAIENRDKSNIWNVNAEDEYHESGQ